MSVQADQATLDMLANMLASIAEDVANLSSQVAEIHSTFTRLKPLLDRYERASQANGLLAQRRAMKGKADG